MANTAQLLYKLFGKERVEAELEKFLEFDFFERVGGGIGMTRMIAALETLDNDVQVANGVIAQSNPKRIRLARLEVIK